MGGMRPRSNCTLDWLNLFFLRNKPGMAMIAFGVSIRLVAITEDLNDPAIAVSYCSLHMQLPDERGLIDLNKCRACNDKRGGAD